MESSEQGELPMVVWLRGDEDYFADFAVESTEVMDLLGIKRSRLTQISGKELRVGRKKVDRYIRPVYRRQDVDEYLAWLRPTASHQKSSQVLFDAASQLSQKSDEINAQYHESLQKILTAIRGQGVGILSGVFAQVQDAAAQVRLGIRAVRDQGGLVQDQLLQGLQRLRQADIKAEAKIDGLGKDVDLLKDLLGRLLHQQNYHNQELLTIQELLGDGKIDRLLLGVEQLQQMQAEKEKIKPSGGEFLHIRDRAGRCYLRARSVDTSNSSGSSVGSLTVSAALARRRSSSLLRSL